MMSMIEECLEEVKFVIYEKVFLPSVLGPHCISLSRHIFVASPPRATPSL